jgi:hypothetical protein
MGGLARTELDMIPNSGQVAIGIKRAEPVPHLMREALLTAQLRNRRNFYCGVKEERCNPEWASQRVPIHERSGGLTRSSEKVSKRCLLKIRRSEGVSKTNNDLILTTLRRKIWLNQRSIERYEGASVLKSRMMGDYHVRFCERLRGEIPLCLLYFYSILFT